MSLMTTAESLPFEQATPLESTLETGNFNPRLHIGRRWGAGVLFLAGLDPGISPNGAVWAAGRTIVIESYKRVSPQMV